METKPNDHSITSESAPLIEPVDLASDQDLFMVPLKRPSPRLPPARYADVRARSPSRSPAAPSSPRPTDEKSPQPGSQRPFDVNPYQSPPMSGHTVKPESPPMFTSPLMSPDSGTRGADGSPHLQGSAAQRGMATPESLAYNSPPMSGPGTKLGSSPIVSQETASARQSPQPEASSKEHTTSGSRSTREDKANNPSTKPSSIYNSPPADAREEKAGSEPGQHQQQQQQQHQKSPELAAPLSATRGARSPPDLQPPLQNLGLALQLDPSSSPALNPDLLAPRSSGAGGHGGRSPHQLFNPKSPSQGQWTVPDSPQERLSQLRATPDSAYDRARQMEVRRSEWKHVVYRFPVRGADHWVIDADLTESSHARLADVARRSSEGFEWNGDYELANIYRVLALAHTQVMEEMREERRRGAARA